MIGGIDVILECKPGVRAADVIFRAARRHWPRCVYEDADDEAPPFEPPGAVWPPTPKGNEFFIYRDEEAARSWDELGATDENRNAMLHVLLPSKANGEAPQSVTIVCGEPPGEVKAMLEEIQEGLAGRPGNANRA